jgi:ATP-binding cassette subfamily A (ABC1) protein 3
MVLVRILIFFSFLFHHDISLMRFIVSFTFTGKTTIMAILTAEYPLTSGDAYICGHSVSNNPEMTRRLIGYCPQFDAHFQNMTGREHVELYAAIKGVPRKSIREAASAKLREVGLAEGDWDKLSSKYSGGMKRKLSVACATIGDPKVRICDCLVNNLLCSINATYVCSL